MTGKRTTIKEVAALAGVSIATVSNVFSGSKPVNAELRRRVEEAASELSYQKDRAAAQLRSGRARVVGVLVPDLDDAFFTSLVSRLEIMARGDGYDVIVASSRDERELELSRLRALLGWRPSGLIAVPCSDIVPDMLVEEAGRLPMVLVDRVASDGAIADTVTIDNCDAGRMSALHLLDMGHADILLAASDLGISPIRERVRGAAEAIAKAGRPAPRVVELGSNAERGAEIMAAWLEGNLLPSAIFALTNVTTLSVLMALARLRIDMPGTVSLIGFDDYAWMSARRTGLTAIRQPVDEMARLIWTRLGRRMAGDDTPPLATVLRTSLQARQSIRPIVAAEILPAGKDILLADGCEKRADRCA